MAIQTGQIPRTGLPAGPVPGASGLFGTGAAHPLPIAPSDTGTGNRAADRYRSARVTPVPASVAPEPARPASAPIPEVDAELESAVEFATDFSVDLLRCPARLAPPRPRLTSPLRQLLSGLRGVARRAAH